MAQNQIQKTSWWHEQLVDWEVMYPHKTLGECAAYFNVTQSWLSVVRNSDAFKEFRRNRLAEHQSVVSMSVVEKAEAITHMALDGMLGKIEEEKKELSLMAYKEVAQMGLRALGYGNGPVGRGGAAIGQFNQFNIGADVLQAAQERMKERHEQNERKQLEGKIVDGVLTTT